MGLYIIYGSAICKDINKPSPSWVVDPIIGESPRAKAPCSRPTNEGGKHMLTQNLHPHIQRRKDENI